MLWYTEAVCASVRRTVTDQQQQTAGSNSKGGVIITHTTSSGDFTPENVYLFPRMLDHYQLQLTRMLETEQYGEARKLLHFLLQCRGEEVRHYEEWQHLLDWLDMAFPEHGQAEDEGADEEMMRRLALDPGQHDEAYVRQVIYIMKHHPMVDQQLLALERAALLHHPEVEDVIRDWLSGQQLHPVLQFKALQFLRKRGANGEVSMQRGGERVTLRIEDTPLSEEEFPPVVGRILERVERITEIDDPTLPHFAREMWKECLHYLYGTTTYVWMLRGDEETVDCFAAALHLSLMLAAYGKADDEQIRDTYGITEALRFRYEQACRVIRQIGETSYLSSPDSES